MNNNHFVNISFLFLTKNPPDLGFFVKKRTLNLHYATTDVCTNNLLTSARLMHFDFRNCHFLVFVVVF